eukprot:scaffold631_cov378-Prasinococcus_capsulatus_cf.AAC.29
MEQALGACATVGASVDSTQERVAFAEVAKTFDRVASPSADNPATSAAGESSCTLSCKARLTSIRTPGQPDTSGDAARVLHRSRVSIERLSARHKGTAREVSQRALLQIDAEASPHAGGSPLARSHAQYKATRGGFEAGGEVHGLRELKLSSTVQVNAQHSMRLQACLPLRRGPFTAVLCHKYLF